MEKQKWESNITGFGSKKIADQVLPQWVNQPLGYLKR